MNTFRSVIAWLLDPAHWGGPAGILARLVEHVLLSAAVLLVVIAFAVPVGAWVGHTRRGQTTLAALTNVSRALPTLGLVSLCALWLGIGLRAPFIALTVLAIPSVLLATAAGTAAVSPVVVEAARALGHTPLQVWWRVELPISCQFCWVVFATPPFRWWPPPLSRPTWPTSAWDASFSPA